MKQITEQKLQSQHILESLNIEIDNYPADACFNVDGYGYIGTYSKDRQTVCIMIADNREKDSDFALLPLDTIKEIAYTCKRLITNYGCSVHSYTMKHDKPFTNLTIEKVSSPSPSNTEPIKEVQGVEPTPGTLPEETKEDIWDWFTTGNVPDENGDWLIAAKFNPDTIIAKGLTEEIAEHICKSVNAFPAMLEALKRIEGITARFSIDTMTTINSIAKSAIQSATK